MSNLDTAAKKKDTMSDKDEQYDECDMLLIAWFLISTSSACKGMTFDEKLEAFKKHVVPAIMGEE